MIERSVIRENKKEFQIQEYISKTLKNVGLSQVKLQKTPLGEKVIIHTSRPGLVVGRKGESISKLNHDLKREFKLENPQIEIVEVENPDLDARILAERIASNLERFGSKRFKAVMHKTMEGTLRAGALGIEILLSGKVPSQRARTWRVFEGYLKKCGHIAQHDVKVAYAQAHLKTGVVGIKVSIMPNIKLPYQITIFDEPIIKVEEVVEEKVDKPKKTQAKPAQKKRAPAKKKAPVKKKEEEVKADE
jgi:small subunit ribosomal protein S3